MKKEVVLLETNFPDLKFVRKGKARDVYDLGEFFLIEETQQKYLDAYNSIVSAI